MVLALAIVVHSILMFVYYLRTKLYIRYCRQEDILPTSVSNSSSLDNSGNSISMVFGHENRVFDISSEIGKTRKEIN